MDVRVHGGLLRGRGQDRGGCRDERLLGALGQPERLNERLRPSSADVNLRMHGHVADANVATSHLDRKVKRGKEGSEAGRT
jgi:hypothetical protein